jgi:hypothetical protein
MEKLFNKKLENAKSLGKYSGFLQWTLFNYFTLKSYVVYGKFE